MSQSERADQERQRTGYQIADAVDRAQTALNRYDHKRKQMALFNQDPDAAGDVYESLVLLDAAVMNAYRKLRKYIKDDLEDEYWNTKIVGREQGRPIILGGRDSDIESNGTGDVDGDEEEPDIPENALFLEDFQGAIRRETQEQHIEFEGQQETTSIEPVLMPVPAYRTAVNLLDEIRNQLGFAPDPKKSVPRTEITEELMEEVEKWRQQNFE